ncbi:kinase-like domain-containing protein [Rhexocercosporidium sp. MPI-PUGE-AT-0058]|nr:kinase-like domain-containing protein [Rhexocercosporidium sp. MPI-PUGE-AT-0058]
MTSTSAAPRWIGKDEDFNVVFPPRTQLPFRVLQSLGKGYFGIVHKIQVDDRYLARKTTKNITHLDKSKIAEVQNEINVMRTLGLHRHIVQIVGSYTQDMQYGILLSPVADCNLEQFLKNSLGPSQDAVQRRTMIVPTMIGCLTSGLSWAHAKNVRHKDLKPNNVLILNNKVLISDFGLAIEFDKDSSTMDNTGMVYQPYKSPEHDRGEERNRKSDIFTLGCIFLDMYTVMSGNTPQAREDAIGPTFCLNLPAVHKWLDSLSHGRAPSELLFHATLKKMFSEQKDDRPSAMEVWKCALASRTGEGTCFCGECCLTIDIEHE